MRSHMVLLRHKTPHFPSLCIYSLCWRYTYISCDENRLVQFLSVCIYSHGVEYNLPYLVTKTDRFNSSPFVSTPCVEDSLPYHVMKTNRFNSSPFVSTFCVEDTFPYHLMKTDRFNSSSFVSTLFVEDMLPIMWW